MGGLFHWEVICLALLVAFVILQWWASGLFCGLDEAVRLNLTVEGPCMAKIGDTFVATIRPETAAGLPAQVFDIVYEQDSDYDITVAPDGLSAVLVAKTAGAGNTLTVLGVTKGGASLVETVDLPDVDSPPVDEEAVKLNLTVTPA